MAVAFAPSSLSRPRSPILVLGTDDLPARRPLWVLGAGERRGVTAGGSVSISLRPGRARAGAWILQLWGCLAGWPHVRVMLRGGGWLSLGEGWPLGEMSRRWGGQCQLAPGAR